MGVTVSLNFAVRFWNESPAALWASCFVIGLAVETAFGSRAPVRHVLLNLRYSAIYCATLFLLSPWVFVGVSAVAGGIGLGMIDLTNLLRTQGLPAQVGFGVLNLLLVDFFYYWMHRAQHRFAWLWDQHKVHHSEEHLNVTTSTRHSWTEFILQAFAISLPIMVLFKLPPITVTTISTLFVAWTFFIHTNLPLQLGRWSWLVVGPQGHRIHHSRLPEHTDRNFAAYFPVWDVLFGTYWAPQRGEFPPTGLVSGERISSATHMAVAPFAAWVHRALTPRIGS